MKMIGFLENSMKVQDSLLYSKIILISIKVGRSINEWRDIIQKLYTLRYFYFQGQINIETSLNAQIKTITD